MKKLLIIAFLLLMTADIFCQSYDDYLKKAKDFEAKKQWCQALGAYYDALGTDEDPAKKKNAWAGYNELADLIKAGNPGRGKFNPFTLHDEWKNLLMDAEKFGSSFPSQIIKIENLEQGDLDYKTKTATYFARVWPVDFNDRYKKTVSIIKYGYEKAYKQDWSSDLPNPEQKFRPD